MSRSPDSTLDIMHYVRMFWRRRSVIMLCAVLVVCAAAVGLQFVELEYESMATLRIEDRRHLSSQLEDLVGGLQGGARGYRADEARLDELVARIESRSFLERLVRLLKMNEDPRIVGAAQQALAGNFETIMSRPEPILISDAESDAGSELHDANTYNYCFGCQTCTNVCPVVDSYDSPEQTLGLLPHQIMCCLGLGLVEMATGSKMLWDCVTCYQCQEHCPQQVKVTDILYRLKNLAVKNMEKTGIVSIRK